MAVTVFGSRPEGADGSRALLRDTFASTLPDARRLAELMLVGAAHRDGKPLDVQILDRHGVLLWSKTAGGAR